MSIFEYIWVRPLCLLESVSCSLWNFFFSMQVSFYFSSYQAFGNNSMVQMFLIIGYIGALNFIKCDAFYVSSYITRYLLEGGQYLPTIYRGEQRFNFIINEFLNFHNKIYNLCYMQFSYSRLNICGAFSKVFKHMVTQYFKYLYTVVLLLLGVYTF